MKKRLLKNAFLDRLTASFLSAFFVAAYAKCVLRKLPKRQVMVVGGNETARLALDCLESRGIAAGLLEPAPALDWLCREPTDEELAGAGKESGTSLGEMRSRFDAYVARHVRMPGDEETEEILREIGCRVFRAYRVRLSERPLDVGRAEKIVRTADRATGPARWAEIGYRLSVPDPGSTEWALRASRGRVRVSVESRAGQLTLEAFVGHAYEGECALPVCLLTELAFLWYQLDGPKMEARVLRDFPYVRRGSELGLARETEDRELRALLGCLALTG